MTEKSSSCKAGYCAIVGKPNVGKSTILNQILDYKLSIVSPKPETTRQNILGVYTRGNVQIAFLDTPGIHAPKNYLSRIMVTSAKDAILEAHVVVMVVDAQDGLTREDALVGESLAARKVPVLITLNKVDIVKKSRCLPIIAALSRDYPFVREILPMSARSPGDVDILVNKITEYLPDHPPYFPPDMLSDRPEKFFAAELIREKTLLFTRREVPYALAVRIEEFRDRKDIVYISAFLYVERATQKKIIIGARGEMLKKIGQEARRDIEAMLDKKAYLDLWVKVLPQWRKNPSALHMLGYT
jgi:GTP-binding protein Era